jgi:hypothetical protein
MTLQWCCSGVAVVLQWCCSGVAVVLPWCYRGVTVVLQLCHSCGGGGDGKRRKGKIMEG